MQQTFTVHMLLLETTGIFVLDTAHCSFYRAMPCLHSICCSDLSVCYKSAFY